MLFFSVLIIILWSFSMILLTVLLIKLDKFSNLKLNIIAQTTDIYFTIFTFKLWKNKWFCSSAYLYQQYRLTFICSSLRYSAGVNPIGMATSCVGDLCPQDIKIVTDMGSLSVGDFYDWSSASAMPDPAFAIKFTIVNGQYRVTSNG